MKLKKLILYGFKSFADKTVMNFQPGLTAIVGPNGCGKSNVVDALRWVMGETHAKAIRGDKMYDVLFNGTKTRSKTSYAEVSLVFDEINNEIAVPYEEVTITRRLFSDGGSSYYLNKQEIRLKDLHALFANTGIGKNAFWVFEQGKIDQIVTMSGLELRTIFEDASGISLYLFQKKEAKSRFKEVEQNLLRANDRIQEKEKFIQILKKQKEDALLWQKTKNDLVLHEKGYFFKKLSAINNKLDDLQKIKTDLVALSLDKEQSLQKLQQDSKQQEAELFELSQQKEAKKELHFETKKQIYHAQEKKRQQKSLKDNLANIEIEIAQYLEKSPLHQQKLLEMLAEFETLRSFVNSEKVSLKTIENEVFELSQSESRLQNTLFQTSKAHQKAQFDKSTLELKKESSEKEILECETSLKQLNESLQERAAKKGSLQLEFDELKRHFESQKLELQSQQSQLSDLDKKLKEKDQSIVLHYKKISELQIRIKTLNSLKNELEGSSNGTKELYKFAKDPKHPLFNQLHPLADWLDVDIDMAESVANAVHPYTHAFVVENDTILKTALNVIKTHNLINVALISQESIQKLVKIHVVDTVEQVVEIPSWTKDGFWFTEHFIAKTKLGEHNAFLRQSEVKKLQKDLSSLEEIDKALHLEKNELLISKESIQQAIRTQEGLLKQKEIKLMELKYHLQNELESFKKEEEKKSTLLKKLEMLSHTFKLIDDQKEHFSKEISLSEEKINQSTLELEKVKAALHEKRELLQHKKNTVQLNEKELFAKLSLKEKMASEAQHNQLSLEQKLAQKNKYLKELEHDGSVDEKELAALEQLEMDTSNILKNLETQYQELLTLTRSLKLQIDELAKETNTFKTKLNETEMRLFEQETKKESIKQELFEKYGTHELSRPEIELSFDKYEMIIRECRAVLATLPSINPQANDEYELEAAQLIDLQNQIRDLKESLEEVEKLIQELDQKSRLLFQETFVKVAAHFKENFTRLFNGGHADLVLNDTMDLLETEVEIKCEPPGKSLKSLQLMSGGEKCLTAIALLFALFQVKPAPMCLLDEIDAPLDEANARRFLDLIEPFAHQTKIILVTHNKITMEKAHQLIGISMQEKGITKVIDLCNLQSPVLVEQ